MKKNKPVISCKDFLVSAERFELFTYKDLEILKTSPVPQNLDIYYKSEKYISHTDSYKGIINRMYQAVKSYMLKQKLNWIASFSKPGKLLDIGAGTGDFLLAAQTENWEVEGVEPNSSARELAREKSLKLKESTGEIKSSFNCITMWHVLEHIPNLEDTLKELKTLLNRNGVLVIAVPNFKSFDARYYKEYWAAYDVPRHIWHFSQQGIKDLFKKHNFDLLETKALKFDSFYVSLLSEKHKKGKANLLKAAKIGLQSNLKARKTGEYSSLVYFFKNSPQTVNKPD